MKCQSVCHDPAAAALTAMHTWGKPAQVILIIFGWWQRSGPDSVIISVVSAQLDRHHPFDSSWKLCCLGFNQAFCTSWMSRQYTSMLTLNPVTTTTTTSLGAILPGRKISQEEIVFKSLQCLAGLRVLYCMFTQDGYLMSGLYFTLPKDV